MHPYCKRAAGDGGIEALLQEQEALGLQGERPSVSVKRTKPKEEKVPVAKPSLFKLRQGQANASETHPELQALGEALGSGEENPPCLKEVSERQAPLHRREVDFAAPESGFPVPLHRAVGKSLGATLKKPAADLDREPKDEDEAIDLENRKTLMNASREEVKEWQQQLLQQLGAETCERLRQRGARKMGQEKRTVKVAKEVAPEPKKVLAEKELHEDKTPAPTVSLEMGGEGLGVLDRSELQKLQWTTPAGEPDFDKVLADASLPPEPCGRALQLMRFDFDGRVCLRGEKPSEDSTSDGLHHHGAESSQAGYTLAELLLLSRSASTPQRAAAIHVLGEVLKRARIPAPQDVLSADLAIRRTRLYDEVPSSAPCRAGFGLGLQVFFWHVLARSDVPKHLAEALADPAQPVQLAALRATVELLDGVAEGEVAGDVIRTSRSVAKDVCHSTVEAALARPWDAARSLVWPSAPPGCAEVLARGTVAVLAAEGFGGHGGGQSAWPPLLKRELLGAKDEPEVAATQVLEPLLPLGEMPSLGRFLPPTSDEKQLALLARALASAAVLRPELCARLLREDHRAIWIASAESASAETQVEVLRFIRMSCEVVGRGAVAWWLKEEGTKLLALLRRSVLSPLKGKGSSNFEALCAVEALRCWISFLRCGAGCDRLESFAAEIGTYWHRFAVQDFEDDVMEGHFLLTAHLLELTLEVFRLREAQEVEEPVDPLQSLHAGIASSVSSAFCAASPVLAKRLSRVENTSAAQQLCLATFADVLDVAVSAAMASQRLEGVDSPLRPAKQLLAAQGDAPLPEVEVCGDEAAPWPLGGAYKSSSLAALARLRALGALARLGGKLEGSKEWLQALRRRALEAVQRRAPKLPFPAATEALVGDVTGDPISALLIDVCLACQEPLSSDDFGQALAISGSWPTAQALFRHAGLDFGEGEDAIVRAAFQPHAVWSEDVPEALGPPSLSLAAAPFWALATASSQGRIRALLKPLVTPEAVDLSKAVPPWLPFVTFASLLAGHSKAWRDETCRELLERYVDRHLRSSPSWKDYLSQEWISELMRGLCDRLAKIFLEESFMDSLLASTLWSFSASFMPPACRAVCWGEDATLLRFLDRALLCESSTLLWQLEDYVALEGAASRLENTNARTWPRAIAARSASAGGLHTTPQEKLDLDSLE